MVLLEEEIILLSRANELRVREFANIVHDYAAGTIKWEEAEERLHRYHQRWGEAISGVGTARGKTDEQLIAEVDASTPQARRKHYRDRFGRELGASR
jgi:hypothetical protein